MLQIARLQTNAYIFLTYVLLVDNRTPARDGIAA